jgi:hypothetical protein
MKIYKYKNYTEYIHAQKSAYKKKYNNVWAREENIRAIAEYIVPRKPLSGLCHGVRQGHELQWFKKYLPTCSMVGTDIGGENKKLHILQRDFNLHYPDFDGCFDFVYSNSFDHSYPPDKTFNIWVNQITYMGLIILEYDRRQEHTGEISRSVNKTDPVSIRIDELVKLVPEWSNKAKVIDILDMPVITQEWRKAVIIEVNHAKE